MLERTFTTDNLSKLPTYSIVARRMRETQKYTRKDAAILLGLNYKMLEAIENGRRELSNSELLNMGGKYGFNSKDIESIISGKVVQRTNRKDSNATQKICNISRRSYKKIIKKENEVLKTLRLIKGYSQYKAGALCGYPKATIGHIENGRIELSEDRIRHIVKNYGFKFDVFQSHMGKNTLYHQILDDCNSILKDLSEEKLQAIHGILMSFKNS